MENDLDAILGELCVLESHFNSDEKRSPDRMTDTPTDPPPPPAPLQLEELLATGEKILLLRVLVCMSQFITLCSCRTAIH